MKIRITILFASILLALAFAPITAWAVTENVDISGPATSGSNWTFDGTILTVNAGADVEVTGTVTGSTRIVATGTGSATITLSGVSITGLPDDANGCPLLLGAGINLTLTLKDGTVNTLTAKGYHAGVEVSEGSTLTINGSGKLIATGGPAEGGGAGIGSRGSDYRLGLSADEGQRCGKIIIDGGIIEANGGDGSAGIGGGGYSSGGYVSNGGGITINGGTITATGSSYSAGIGGGSRGTGGDITINGGTVTAISGWGGGAGIGGGADDSYGNDPGYNGGNITISGGTVTATGKDNGAGIGGGNKSVGGNITISGGTVTATGGSNGGAGIGGGTGTSGVGSTFGNGGSISISGGVVTANGGPGGAGIGGGLNAPGSISPNTIEISGGTVIATGGSADYKYGAGIGGGGSTTNSGNNKGGDIVISGGIVVAEATPGSGTIGYKSNGIGGGNCNNASKGGNANADSGTLTISGSAIVFTTGGENGVKTSGVGATSTNLNTPGGVLNNTWNSDITITGEVTLPSGSDLTIPADKTLTITSPGILYNEADITNDGTIDGTGYIQNINGGGVTGNGGQVRETPTLSDLTFTIPTDHIYDGTVQGFNVTPNSPITADEMGEITVLYDGVAASSTFPKNAKTYALITVNIAGGTKYAAVSNLSLGATSYTIAPKLLSTWDPSSPGTVHSKEYNGTDNATVDVSPILSGIVSGDQVTVTGNVIFNAVNVGSNIGITASGWSIGGSGASNDNYNYTGTQEPVFADGVITPKQLAWNTDGTVQNKVYDGTATATTLTLPTLDGIATIDAGDISRLGVQTGSVIFSSANVGATINASEWGITGTNASNYTPPTAQPVFSGAITPKSISGATVTISGTYIYNGSPHTPAANDVTVDLTGFGTLTSPDDYTYSVTTGGTDAGTATVTVTGTGNFAGTETGTFTIVRSYDVTVLSAGSGAIGSGNYIAGATVDLYAGTAPSRYRFSNWTVSGASLADANRERTSFIMPANDVTVTANFEFIPIYYITAGSFNGGAVSANITSAGVGETITLTVQTNAGYRLDKIVVFKTEDEATTVETQLIASSQTYTFTMPAYDVTVRAAYATPDQIAIEEATEQIMSTVFDVQQTAANTQSEILGWLVETINAQLAPTGVSVAANNIVLVNFMAAIAGTENNPSGRDGAIRFQLTITKGNSSATIIDLTAVIAATRYFPAGIEDIPQAKAMKAYVQNGTLYISGLTAGEQWSVYNISGSLIYSGVANSDEVSVSLSARGMYIVKSGKSVVKVMD